MSFETDIGRCGNTPLSKISTSPNYTDLGYGKNLKYYLDEETVTPNQLLPEEHYKNYRSDEEVEKNMC